MNELIQLKRKIRADKNLHKFFYKYNFNEIIGQIYLDANSREYDGQVIFKYRYNGRTYNTMEGFIDSLFIMTLTKNPAYIDAYIECERIKQILIIPHENNFYYISIPISNDNIDTEMLYYHRDLKRYIEKNNINISKIRREI